MTMHEKVVRELQSSQRNMAELKKDISEMAQQAAACASNDAYGMTPGLCLSQAALNMTIYGTRLRELANRINMLEWLLSDTPSDEG